MQQFNLTTFHKLAILNNCFESQIKDYSYFIEWVQKEEYAYMYKFLRKELQNATK